MKRRRESTVYNFLKAEQQSCGSYTARELVDRLSAIHGIEKSKSFSRQVALALRRGVTYGILVRTRNKYRFDPVRSLLRCLRAAKRPTRRRPAARKEESRPRAPRPTVPPPPNWTPRFRNLLTEPFAKEIKRRPRTSPALPRTTDKLSDG